MNKSMILRYKVAEGYIVKSPAQKTLGSAGIDLHIPEFTKEFLKDFNELNRKIANAENMFSPEGTKVAEPYLCIAPGSSLILPPHTRCIVPSGLYFDIPEGWMLEGANRGSVSSIQGVIHGAHIIDSDYQGMVFMSIINTSNTPKSFLANTALLQVLFREAPRVALFEVRGGDLYKEKTVRGEGALGSTDGDEHGGN